MNLSALVSKTLNTRVHRKPYRKWNVTLSCNTELDQIFCLSNWSKIFHQRMCTPSFIIILSCSLVIMSTNEYTDRQPKSVVLFHARALNHLALQPSPISKNISNRSGKEHADINWCVGLRTFTISLQYAQKKKLASRPNLEILQFYMKAYNRGGQTVTHTPHPVLWPLIWGSWKIL